MARVARKVKDRRVLALIRKFLESGILANGVKVASEEGVPQGGPLSPLLSNILLDDLDRELARRGHRFCRYADDCNVYVRSQRAGDRVMRSMRVYLVQVLGLLINEAKSAVARPWRRKFLGFTFTYDRHKKVRLAPQSLQRVKMRIRALTRSRETLAIPLRIQRLNQYLVGWLGYFALADIHTLFQRLDEWLRRRLRACQWRLWRRVRTRSRELLRLGAAPDEALLVAWTRKGSWHMSDTTSVNRLLSNAYWQRQGLVSLEQRYIHIRNEWRTAVCGPARTVV